jgi:hypothetical protein
MGLAGCFDVRWSLVLLFLAAGSVVAAAEEYRGTEEARAACTGDVFRLCWSEIPNVTRIVGCLQREKRQLSAGCRQVFESSSVRVAYQRWQHRRHHLASNEVQPSQSPQAERHGEMTTMASMETSSPSYSTAKDTRARAVHELMHQRSHAHGKYAVRHGHSKHKWGHRASHRYALEVGKPYRHHSRIHRG